MNTLGKAIKARRDELGLTQDEVTRFGGPSAAAVRYYEAGRSSNPTSRTRMALENALGWESGSVAAILAGGEPTVRTQRVSVGAGREQIEREFRDAVLKATQEYTLKLMALDGFV